MVVFFLSFCLWTWFMTSGPTHKVSIVLYSNVSIFSFSFIYLTKLAPGAGHSPLYVVCILWAPVHLIFVTTLWSGSCLCPLFPPPHTILRWGNQKKKFRTLIKVTQLVCGEVRIQTSSQATKPRQLWSWYQVLFVFVCGRFKNAHWIFPIFFFPDIYLFDCAGS